MKLRSVIFSVCLAALFLTACGTKSDKSKEASTQKEPATRADYLAQVKSVEKKMHSATMIDPKLAGEAIKAYTDFTEAYPKDSLTPDMLFKAGQVAGSAQRYREALGFYQKVYNLYPNFKYAPDCLFLQGYLYDSYLKNDSMAKKMYQQVINKYPDNKLAQDAKAAIQNLGKSDEELIKEFEAKNKKKKKNS